MAVDLKAERVVDTVRRLCVRIRERFPEANLNAVAEQLHEKASAAAAQIKAIAKPHFGLRLATSLLTIAIPVSIGVAVWEFGVRAEGPTTLGDFITMFQAGVESLFFIGVGIAFLMTLENRHKRSRALATIHELRVLAHLVDMHQLDKDPVYILHGGPTTQSSPRRTMTAFELNRYLDYCSEMLALVGKLAALYGKDLNDSVALAAVDQVESLTTGLSRKIWQKEMLLDRAVEG